MILSFKIILFLKKELKQVYLIPILILFVTSCAQKSVDRIPDEMKDVPRYQEIYLDNGDSLQIDYPYWPEMGTIQQDVRKDGKISLPLLGDIFVAGLTVEQLHDKITQSYRKVLIKPEITVILRSVANQSVFIAGEVTQPGSYKYTPRMTLLEAIISAGNYIKRSAALQNVVVIRHIGEKRYVAFLNLENYFSGESKPFYLASHDIIFIPRTKIDVVDQWVEQYLTRVIEYSPFSFQYYPNIKWAFGLGG